ncbi:hypothetical protein RFM23_02755 [Mesorhizobium abyssinicae]|uniref:Uncharacterized protein n=1 Tax=Mesorhizobium abyssinicae TaxID=1209958 RepID=A0ABU5AGX3_9HYPH|nr:hypothetical protein [Mesorhizobium abyssinicae]MDX8536536.1 hypothetical protein [Mesorhizobium abyssinicae]
MRHPPQSKTVSNMVDFVQSNVFALISEAVGAHAITSACFMRRWASLGGDAPDFLDRPADQILMGRHPLSFLGRRVIGAVPDRRHMAKIAARAD